MKIAIGPEAIIRSYTARLFKAVYPDQSKADISLITVNNSVGWVVLIIFTNPVQKMIYGKYIIIFTNPVQKMIYGKYIEYLVWTRENIL
ncbi:hypothetical protein BJP37_21120 [Moorena bouillonii PNG]|uniref:Uncharacterized protein n=1 Tax=Moorena bouillonii PNG TaxID=568701 RepID=A0A1U7N5B9_9CYAN|nr:hypothetical protein BJP37_21120 [Moorena bouillonii PNG]